MKVAVVYNEPKHTPIEEHWLSRSSQQSQSENFRDGSEFGVLEQMRSIQTALELAGHTVTIFSADDDVLRLCNFLRESSPEIIFNCCESILGRSALEMNVAALYELFNIAYTGSAALTLGIALNKGLSKDLLASKGIRTPRHFVAEVEADLEELPYLHFPLIVKPIKEDASIGIDSNSIVQDSDSLRDRIRFVHREFTQAAIVEEYIDGRELNVALIADASGKLKALPVSEILFNDLPEGSPRIVSYEAKWVEDSPMYRSTTPRCPAELPESIANEAMELARATAEAIGIRDYGRIDFRYRTTDNKLFVLEANPNPDLSSDAGFMRAATVSGRTFDGTITEILECAIERSQHVVR